MTDVEKEKKREEYKNKYRNTLAFQVRNNGHLIGEVKVKKRNFIKFAGVSLAAGAAIVVISIASSIIGTKETEPNGPVIVNPIGKDEEARYNIPYTIKPTDTISDIVFSYESDTNKAYDIIDRIADASDIKNVNTLRDGAEVTLVDVPASKLEQFGYTVDYSLVDPEDELKDRKSYVDKVLVVSKTPETQAEFELLRDKKESLAAQLRDYYGIDDAELKDYLLDHLLEEYRELCEQVEKYTGKDFDKYRTIYPLDETLAEEKTK